MNHPRTTLRAAARAGRLLPLALVLPAVLAATPARAADDVPSALFGSEHEARGEYGEWLRELLDVFTADSTGTYAPVVLRRIRDLAGYADDSGLLATRLQPVLDEGVADPAVRETLQDLLADRARAAGDFERGDAYGGNTGYLRGFAVVGPFDWSEAALVYRHYPTEGREIDRTTEYEDSRGLKRWTPLPKEDDSAWVSIGDIIRRGGNGVRFATACVRPQAAGDVAFKMWCSESFRVFVNGEPVVTADREHDRVPNPVWFTARLEDGTNRVTVKIAGNSSFALKACDAGSGDPLTSLEVLDPFEKGAPRPTGAAGERTFTTLSERLAEAARERPTAESLAAAAQTLDGEGREWEAYDAFERAAAMALASPAVVQANVLAAYGRFLASFREFPDVQRKNRAKPEFEKAVAAYPGHVSAAVRLARYENEDDRPDKAVGALQKLVSERPNSVAWMALARIADDRGWKRETESAAEAAAAISPWRKEPHEYLAAIDSRYGNHESRVRRMRRVLEIDADDGDAIEAIIESLRAQGKHREALELIDERVARWPGSTGWLQDRAKVLEALDRHDESLAIWQGLAKRRPEDAGYRSHVGHLEELLGNTDAAIAAYEESLKLNGYQPTLWRRLQRLRGEKEDFARAFEPDADRIIAELESTEDLKAKYPKAVAVTVLDHSVVRVRPDGSAENYVHMIWKILDEKGVDKYSNVSNSGDLIEVRAILPDGSEMAPTGLRGRAFNMEGLVPGTIIQHRFHTTLAAGTEGFDGGQFYFQDFEFRRNPNPVLHTRYTILAQEGTKVRWVQRNFDGEPEVREVEDGWTATSWEKRDMPRIEWEQGMPSRDEIVPLVDHTVDPDMDDANWQFLGRRDDSRSSSVLEEALARAVPPGEPLGQMETLRRIHDFVNTEITGDTALGSGAAAVLLEKAGDRGLLFESMMRASGIRYRQGHAMPRRGDGRDLTRASPRDFGASFLWIEPSDAEPFAYFAGPRHAPLGLVPAAFRDTFAYLASTDGGEIVRLPAGGSRVDNGTSFVIHLGPAATDTLVSGTIAYRSPAGYRFKKRIDEMAQDDRQKFAEREISSYFASPALESFEFPGVATRGLPLNVWVNGTMPQYLSRQGKTYGVSLGLPTSDMTGRFVHRPERTYDLILSPNEDRVDEFEIHLGGHWEVVDLPGDHLAVNEIGVYSLTWRHVGDVIRVRRERHLQPGRYTAEEYKDFVKWCKAVDDAEERKLVLRSTQPE